MNSQVDNYKQLELLLHLTIRLQKKKMKKYSKTSLSLSNKFKEKK